VNKTQLRKFKKKHNDHKSAPHFSPCCDFMDFPTEYTTNVYTIPIENIGQFDLEVSI
jgi:hypothetical protein